MELNLAIAVVLFPAWVYLIGAAVAVMRFTRRPLPLASDPPAVSVLKPLHGDEPGLYENLRSFAEQDYPALQIVLGVNDAQDGALPAARALIRDLPSCDVALVVDARASGSNKKVANLENMLEAAARRRDRVRRQRHARRSALSRRGDRAIARSADRGRNLPLQGCADRREMVRIRGHAHQFRVPPERAGRRILWVWAGGVLARRSRCAARPSNASADLRACGTSSPTTTGSATRSARSDFPLSCHLTSSRLASSSRVWPICGDTSCVGRARCGQWRPPALPGRFWPILS